MHRLLFAFSLVSPSLLAQIVIPVAQLGSACAVSQLNPSFFPIVNTTSLPDFHQSGAILFVGFNSPSNFPVGSPPPTTVPTPPQSGWVFVIENSGIRGPWIADAYFIGANWTNYRNIIKQAGLADILVAYHGGTDIYDLNPYAAVREIKATDLPAVGGGLVTLFNSEVTSKPDQFPRIGVECRERGIDWLCKSNYSHPSDSTTKTLIGRGYEVVVWAVLDGGNYDNIVEYIFRDDGSVGFRLGTSGSIQRGLGFPPGEAHMHNGLWRLSTNLFGSNQNRAYVSQHLESSIGAVDTELPITEEGVVDFKPLNFTTILIQNTALTNARGHLMGYEVVPFGRLGTARHDEPWTGHDFWITKDNPGEDGTGAFPDNWRFISSPEQTPDQTMLRYAANKEAMFNYDMTPVTPVIWYRSSVHHHPSDSDLASDGTVGIASVHWAGFDFLPHNAFDYNPMTGGLGFCE